MCICIWVCAHECKSRDIESLGVGFVDSCELLDMDAGNRTQVLGRAAGAPNY